MLQPEGPEKALLFGDLDKAVLGSFQSRWDSENAGIGVNMG